MKKKIRWVRNINEEKRIVTAENKRKRKLLFVSEQGVAT